MCFVLRYINYISYISHIRYISYMHHITRPHNNSPVPPIGVSPGCCYAGGMLPAADQEDFGGEVV